MKRKLQVFVSSTYTDLKEERQSAVAAILKAGHIPAGMELFTAGDKSQMDTIKRWIDESDVYMLILGGRYGSLEPKSTLSYTELEYDYAVKMGKPLFAVVTTDEALEEKVKSRGTEFMEKENPQLLKKFREKVLTNISSFFSDEKDVRLCVYESLSDHAANPKLSGWVAGGEVEDSSLLHDELRTLRAENETLRAQIAQSEKVAQAQPENRRSEQIRRVIDLLLKKDIEIPAELNNGKPHTNSLFDIFYSNRQTLISGVTNQMDSNDAQKFFYFTVCPELQIHGLVDNEKVAGVRYRRSAVSKFGMEVLAECERRLATPKPQKGKQ